MTEFLEKLGIKRGRKLGIAPRAKAAAPATPCASSVARTHMRTHMHAHTHAHAHTRTHTRAASAAVAVALAILLTLTGAPFAHAADPIDPTKPVSLTLVSEHEGRVIPGMIVNIYRIATVSSQGTYEKTEAFKNYPVELNGLDPAGLSSLATTLRGYVARDGIVPDDAGITDEKGVVVFPQPQKKLEQGIYLVVGLQTKLDTWLYTPAAFIISVPRANSSQTGWEYDITANQKLIKEPADAKKTIKVVKEWKDAVTEADHPNSVTVDLIKDNNVYDTVVLSAQNNWMFTWENLDSSSTWLVAEQVPSDYTVSITQNENTFVVTNTQTPYKKPPPASEKLPQTGVLWWPVPVLALVGALLLFAGMRQARRSRFDAEG